MCQATASIFFLQLEINYYDNAPPGLNWNSLQRCNLRSNEISVLTDSKRLGENQWLSALIEIDEAEGSIYSIAGSRVESRLGFDVIYRLVAIDSRTGEIKKTIAELESQTL